MKENGLVEV